MRKRNRINNIADLNRLPVTPRSTTGGESVLTAGVLPTSRLGLKQYAAAYDKAEQEKADAPIKKLEAEINQTLRELRKVQAENVFTYPSDELAVRCSSRPDFVEGTAAQIADQVLAAARASGINPNQSGRDKIVAVLKVNPMIDTRKPENWKALYDFLIEIRVLTVEDGVPEIVQPIPQAAAPQSEGIEHLSTETREGRAEILRLTGLGWSSDFQTWALDWADSLRQNFGFEFDFERLGEKAASFITRHNLPYWKHDTWNQIRVAFVKLGYFPDALLLPSEQLAALVEGADMSNREVRLAFNRKQREIDEAAAKQHR